MAKAFNDSKLGNIKVTDGIDCPYKDKCSYGKTQVGVCKFYWLSKTEIGNVKRS